MTELQEGFLNELKSKAKLTVAEYAILYNKHTKIAIEYEEENGADIVQAKAMGNYYTVAILSNFVSNENLLTRIISHAERLSE